jgi:RNA exonuclease 4
MVGVNRTSDALARVSIINYNGHILYDVYVQPEGQVTDYRTWVSGIQPHMLREANGAVTFQTALEQSQKLLKNKILVGHSLQNDLKSLTITDFPSDKVRDVSKYSKYKSALGQA